MKPRIRAVSLQCSSGKNIYIEDNVVEIICENPEQLDIAVADINIENGENISFRGNSLSVKKYNLEAHSSQLRLTRDAQAVRIRKLLNERFKTDGDFMAFCLDVYPDIYKRFSGNMERVIKENILIEINLNNLNKLEEKN